MGFFIVLGLFLWLLVALWPATLAKKKGYSFIVFLLLSWIFSWLLILIITLFLPTKVKQSEDNKVE
jgi:hypothetical protein